MQRAYKKFHAVIAGSSGEAERSTTDGFEYARTAESAHVVRREPSLAELSMRQRAVLALGELTHCPEIDQS